MTTPSPFASPASTAPGVPQPPTAVTTTTTTTQTSGIPPAKSKKKFSLKMVLGGLVIVLLIVGVLAGLYLSEIGQDLRQQAQVDYGECTPRGIRTADNHGAGCCSDLVAVNGICRNATSSYCDNDPCQSGYTCNEETDSCVANAGTNTGTCTTLGAYRCASGNSQKCVGAIGGPLNWTNFETCGSRGCINSTGRCASATTGGNTGDCTEYGVYRCSGTTSQRCLGPVTGPLNWTAVDSCGTRTCVASTGRCGSGTTGGGTGGSGNCSALGASCEASGCCVTGGVCQGAMGSRVCQQQDNSVCAGGGTCTGYVSFQCSSLSTSSTSNGVPVCESNSQNHGTNRSAAVTRASATGCGQLDQVCVGGTNAGSLCGEFTIYSSSCGGGGTPPPSTPPGSTPPTTPTYECNDICTSNSQCTAADSRFRCLDTATGNKKCRLPSNPTSNTCQPPAGPQCLAVRLRKGDGVTPIRFGDNDPKRGESITIFCPDVEGADHYKFRVIEPDGTRQPVGASDNKNISRPYTITRKGKFFAQCQICTGADNSTCNPWENLE